MPFLWLSFAPNSERETIVVGPAAAAQPGTTFNRKKTVELSSLSCKLNVFTLVVFIILPFPLAADKDELVRYAAWGEPGEARR